ncbi:hypothetical protein QCA50_018063 [Cerrena zonata]|uniref:DEAD/DEAH-box helicase domain-containing protein n=1 Tax=Cerrena zonata TaxID=2478898 RepID=A0AAW0FBU5_9APHY
MNLHSRKTSRRQWTAFTASISARKRSRLTQDDIDCLALRLKETCQWDTEPRPFQLEGIKAQLEGVDAIIQASTGSGKTATAAGPHLHDFALGKYTIMVEPLLQLQGEMVKAFDTEFKLNAIAINSKNGALWPLLIRVFNHLTFRY